MEKTATPTQPRGLLQPTGKDENGRTRSKNSSTVFYFLHLKYESENESGQAGHENEHELTEYLEFRKRTNSSGIMSNTVGMQKINTEYWPVETSA